MDYKKAGVDIEAGYKSVELMKKHIAKNHETGSFRRTGWIFRSIFHECIQKYGRTSTRIRYRWLRNQS